MDFGFVSLESLPGPPENGAPGSADPPEGKPKLGSGAAKQERSEEEEEDDDDGGRRASKGAKTATTTKEMMSGQEMVSPVLRSNTLFPCGDQEQMLSFSPFPYYYQRMPRYAGYGSGNQSIMHVTRGALTASQWTELEHQALIYKYITSNVSVPSDLLSPLRKSLTPFGFAAAALSPSPTSFGWVGFGAVNSDPEPGRCRRTDGKKWRCSRDAVAEQKYCERHINRGRHRSRKPVEAHLQSGHPNPTPINNLHNRRGLSEMPPKQETTTAVPPCTTSQPAFGLVSTDSLLNPSQDSPYKTYLSPLLDFGGGQEDNHQRHDLLCRFVDDNAGRSVIPRAPDEVKPGWTQLSMSTPRPAASPPRLSRELEPPTPTSLVLGQSQQGANWGSVPVSWGGSNCSMGGPLGEVLTNTSFSGNYAKLNFRKQSGGSLNLSTEGWDERSTFCSLSNISSGSSPRADYNSNKSYATKKSNNGDGTSDYDEVLASSTLACSSAGCV